MRGIILAGGAGTRLHPMTLATSKQLLPVYDKPLIYYPLSTLILAGVDDILVVTTPGDADAFASLLDDGSWCGVSLTYAVQPEPRGLAQAFTVAPEFTRGHPCCLILGDNLFHGHGLGQNLQRFTDLDGAAVFGCRVADPRRYGVVRLDETGRPVQLEEKPRDGGSEYAVPGIYFYDEHVHELAAELRPSPRGEYEITDLNRRYLDQGRLHVEILPRGTTWLDVGTVDALSDAGNLVRTLQQRVGLLVGSPEEAAWRRGRIDDAQLLARAERLAPSRYSDLLTQLVQR